MNKRILFFEGCDRFFRPHRIYAVPIWPEDVLPRFPHTVSSGHSPCLSCLPVPWHTGLHCPQVSGISCNLSPSCILSGKHNGAGRSWVFSLPEVWKNHLSDRFHLPNHRPFQGNPRDFGLPVEKKAVQIEKHGPPGKGFLLLPQSCQSFHHTGIAPSI